MDVYWTCQMIVAHVTGKVAYMGLILSYNA